MSAISATTALLLSSAAIAAPLSITAGSFTADDGCCASAKAKLVAKQADKTIVETALANESFSTLVTLVGEAKLTEALSGKGPFTVFAPTNAAFAKLDPKVVESLLKEKNRPTLQSILGFHVVSGDLRAKQVVKLKNATTLNGQRLDIEVDEGTVTVDGATVTTVDIACSNGVIHVIDTVMMPVLKDLTQVAAEAKTFDTLLAAAKAAGLAETLATKGPFTVFAPTDEAFAALPEGTVASLLKPENKAQLVAILKNHVVEGRVFADQAAKLDVALTIGGGRLPVSITRESATIAGSKIVATDIEASNGVVHVIDAVMIPE